jgi:GMP synthase (glutamine-hydrolysing)
MVEDPLHSSIVLHHDKVLIVDFGSQVTQLIARRVREGGVYCEIAPAQNAAMAFAALTPKAVILSGGPASVHDEGAPRVPDVLFGAGVPILGICYGQQVMAMQLGGKVAAKHKREFGRAEVEVLQPSALFEGVWEKGGSYGVWMSHGDAVTEMPPGFSRIAASKNAPLAAIADPSRGLYGVQFHLEVAHTPDGAKLISNFVHKIAGLKADWTMGAFRAEAVAAIRAEVGQGRVLCGLSGGVDSAVAALLIHEAIGDRLTCVFVDHGLLRLGEAEEVVGLFRGHYNIPLVHVEAKNQFLNS